jgi:hypothetical protein
MVVGFVNVAFVVLICMICCPVSHNSCRLYYSRLKISMYHCVPVVMPMVDQCCCLIGYSRCLVFARSAGGARASTDGTSRKVWLP